MEQNDVPFRLKNIRTQGFSLAEVVVALFVVSLVLIVLGSLGQQAINFSKKSRQISGVMELRSKTATLLRDTDKWLPKMRAVIPDTSVPAPKALSSCIPSEDDPAIGYDCPVEVFSAAQLDAEPGLRELTDNNKFKVMDTPIVDAMGTPIAGRAAAPVYLNEDGLECKLTPSATSCPLRSVGYFFRENVGATTNPGNVKFVVKVEMNSDYRAKQVIPMKAQYMTMNLGTSWEEKSSNPTGPSACVLPSVFKGIQTDGTPRCEDPDKLCSASGKIQVGYDASGPICQDPLPVATTCGTGEKVILDPVTKTLICSSGSPCSTGGTFTGFYSGSGEPMCSTTTACTEVNHIQMGLDSTTGKPVCKPVATCDPAGEVVTYNGSSFQCVPRNNPGGSSTTIITPSAVCALFGGTYNEKLTPKCRLPEKACINSKVMTGVQANGDPICSAIGDLPKEFRSAKLSNNCGSGDNPKLCDKSKPTAVNNDFAESFETPVNSGERRKWGLRCKQGWILSACSNGTSGTKPGDSDLGFSDNGCQTNDWQQNSIPTWISILCWRIISN